MSRRGKTWARIVNCTRSLIALIVYGVIVAWKPLCGQDARVLVGVKLAGAFTLCCLASFSTRDHHRRIGWIELREVLFSRKTSLLLVYLVAWTYIVNAAVGPWA